MVSQSVSEDHDAVLGAAAGCLPHGQGQGVRPGTKAQHAGAVGPHAPHTWNRADYRTDEEREKKHNHKQNIGIIGGEVKIN